MTDTNEITQPITEPETPVPAATTPAVEQTAPPAAPTSSATRRWLIAGGVAVAALFLAGGIFTAGVAVGSHLGGPGRGQFAQGQGRGQFDGQFGDQQGMDGYGRPGRGPGGPRGRGMMPGQGAPQPSAPATLPGAPAAPAPGSNQ